MDIRFGRDRFWTTFVRDTEAGFAGIQVHCESDTGAKRVAEVLFWDATGQFSLETFGRDVPLDVLEAVIAEAKQTIEVR